MTSVDASAPGIPHRTQAAILGAYTALIEELGTDDVSFRLIARRAGVGERTVFRNFATRVDLLLATAEWIESTAFARRACESIFDAPMAIRETMYAYDRRPQLAHVVAEASVRGFGAVAPLPRRELFERLLQREVPSLHSTETRSIVAALSHIDSAATWVALHSELGWEGPDVSDAAGWAAEAILDTIRDRVQPDE